MCFPSFLRSLKPKKMSIWFKKNTFEYFALFAPEREIRLFWGKFLKFSSVSPEFFKALAFNFGILLKYLEGIFSLFFKFDP